MSLNLRIFDQTSFADQILTVCDHSTWDAWSSHQSGFHSLQGGLKCLVRFSRGDCEGKSTAVDPPRSVRVVLKSFEVCLGLLSCCTVSPPPRIRGWGMYLMIGVLLLLGQGGVTLAQVSNSWEEKHPLDFTFSPPCFTVGLIHWSIISLPWGFLHMLFCYCDKAQTEIHQQLWLFYCLLWWSAWPCFSSLKSLECLKSFFRLLICLSRFVGSTWSNIYSVLESRSLRIKCNNLLHLHVSSANFNI